MNQAGTRRRSSTIRCCDPGGLRFSVLELFFSRRVLLGSGDIDGGHDPPDRRGALDVAGIPDRMPFILGDDGSYDLRLNQFLRELPTLEMSSRSGPTMTR